MTDRSTVRVMKPPPNVSVANEARFEFARLRGERDHYKRMAQIYRITLEVLVCAGVAALFWMAVVS